MNKKYIAPIAAGALVGIGAVGKTALEKMDFNKRNDACAKVFRKTLLSFSKDIPFPAVEENENSSDLFSQGNREVVEEKTKNRWSLGYSKKSILPLDFGKRKYCIAGNTRYPANYAAEVLDDICVRTVVLDDGSGRGKVSFSAVDCIGLSNKMIREIRDELSAFSKDNHLVSINVLSVHDHSSVDTCGIWGEIFSIVPHNRKVALTGRGEMKNSCDEAYLCFVKQVIADSVREAAEDMTYGKLYCAAMGKTTKTFYEQTKGKCSLKDKGIAEYVWDRREPFDCSAKLLRLRFCPNDKNKKETVIINFGAHPYINSLKIKGKGEGNGISGDFVYSLCETVEKAGANAVFFNGAVAGVYPKRLYGDKLDLYGQAIVFGEEMGRIALAMTKTKKEIENDTLLSPESYEAQKGIFAERASLYRQWITEKAEEVIEEKELEPNLDLKITEVPLKVENPIFFLVGKLKIGQYNMASTGDGFSSFTEVGYLKLGNGEVKAALIPGELEPALLNGSYAVQREYSYSKKDFRSPILSASAEDSDLAVFGLCNDAIGYIIPENDFNMMFLGTGNKMRKLFGNHYLEIFSFGKETATAVCDGFARLTE